jgi:multidrug resistance protein, MATE family
MFISEARTTFRLAIPMMIGQVCQMLMAVVDSIMVGHLGVNEMAVLTFANSLFHLPFVFAIGILTCVSVKTSNACGAGDSAAARSSCRHGFYMALVIGVFLFLISWWLSYRLDIFKQPSEVTKITPDYFLILMGSAIPALASIALKNHADALSRPWPPFWISITGVVLNIGLNFLLIDGRAGFPKMGIEGAAVATLIARIFILIGIFVWLVKCGSIQDWVPYKWIRKPVWIDLKNSFQLGFPAGLQMLCEVAVFSAAGLMMGRFDTTSMAAHQIAITCSAVAFMIPLGLSMALTVRVGEAFGAKDYDKMRLIVFSGWLLAGLISIVNAIGFFIFGESITHIFLKDHEVILLGAQLLIIAGVFQIVDGLQVASAAMLRGMQDTKIPALIGLISYWFIGLSTAVLLIYYFNMQAKGVWWGITIGLIAACFMFSLRLWNKMKNVDS